MFKIPRVNVIESDEGFSVEVLGLTGLLYTEGKKMIHMDSEVIALPKGLMIYRGSIKKWDDPYSSEPIDDKKRQMIVENIQRAFRFRGFEIDIY
jgi:hypothetical protein